MLGRGSASTRVEGRPQLVRHPESTHLDVGPTDHTPQDPRYIDTMLVRITESSNTHTHTHALTLQEPTSKLWYWMVAAALWRGARRFSRVRAPLRLNYRKIAIHFILIPAAICYAFLRGFVQEYICIRLISRAFFFLRVLCWH